MQDYARSLNPYAPWRFMLDFDEFAYDPRQHEALRQRGIATFDLSSGTNELGSPDWVWAALRDAVGARSQVGAYDGYLGHLLARRAMATSTQVQAGATLRIDEDSFLITHGAGLAMRLVFEALAHMRPKGEILLPVPTFPLAGACAMRSGLRVREVRHDQSEATSPTIHMLVQTASEDTLGIYLNIFNNPTGERPLPEEMDVLFDWATGSNSFVILDLVSSGLDVEGAGPKILRQVAAHRAEAQTIVINSLSKDKGVPGLRLGWVVAHPSLIRRLAFLNAEMSMSANSPGCLLLFVDSVMSAALSTSRAASADHTALLGTFREAMLSLNLPADLSRLALRWTDTDVVHEYLQDAWRYRAELATTLQTNFECLRSQSQLVSPLGWSGDFNAFVGLQGYDSQPLQALTRMMFFDAGIQLLPGPAFGDHESLWRQNEVLWFRASFCMPASEWESRLARLQGAWSRYSTR